MEASAVASIEGSPVDTPASLYTDVRTTKKNTQLHLGPLSLVPGFSLLHHWSLHPLWFTFQVNSYLLTVTEPYWILLFLVLLWDLG